jgi:hypothetical protein
MLSVANSVRPKGDPTVIASGPSSVYPEERLAKSLGWMSLALGVVEIFAAARITRSLGLDGSENLVRAFGVREIAAGVTTLSTEKETGLWSRVAGDVLDLAVLARGLAASNPQRRNVRWTMLAIAGVTALDALAATSVRARKQRAQPRSFSERSGFPKGLPRTRHEAAPVKKSARV